MNLPNKITLTRICMIPVFVLFFFLDGVLPFARGIAAIVFVLAACTDFIDGHIARSRGLVTNLGKFLDPIADKVLVSTAMLLLLTIKESLFARTGEWADGLYVLMAVCICIIMARELIISAFRQIAAANGVVMAADKLGKFKTIFQDIERLSDNRIKVPEGLGLNKVDSGANFSRPGNNQSKGNRAQWQKNNQKNNQKNRKQHK